MIVDTDKVLREADGPVESDSTKSLVWVERVIACAGEKPEGHKRYALLLFITMMFRNSIQYGMKFYYLFQRFHPMISWKVCTMSEYVGLCNSMELYDMEINQKISMPN